MEILTNRYLMMSLALNNWALDFTEMKNFPSTNQFASNVYKDGEFELVI